MVLDAQEQLLKISTSSREFPAAVTDLGAQMGSLAGRCCETRPARAPLGNQNPTSTHSNAIETHSNITFGHVFG